EADRHQLHAVCAYGEHRSLDRDRRFTYAEQLRNRVAPYVGVDQADAQPGRCERGREVRGDDRFADTSLTAGDGVHPRTRAERPQAGCRLEHPGNLHSISFGHGLELDLDGWNRTDAHRGVAYIRTKLVLPRHGARRASCGCTRRRDERDRKSTRLNSSHVSISY